MKRVAIVVLWSLWWGCSADPSPEPTGEGQRQQALTPRTYTLVKDINPNVEGPVPSSVLECNGWIYISAKHPQGTALYRADSGGNVSPAIAIFPADFPPLLLAAFRPAGATQDMMLFRGTDSDAGTELWMSDGTSAGTQRLADINAGPQDSNPSAVGSIGNRFFFTIVRGGDLQLWQTDGIPAGTTRVSVQPLNGPPVILGSRLLFATRSTTNSELWASDGTPAGTALLKDINPAGPSSPIALTVVGSRVFFFANDGVHGSEPWVTNGTAAGTVLVKDIHPGSESSTPSVVNNKVGSVGSTFFFAANDGVHGEELWKSDGTAAGTVLVLDAAPDAASSLPRRLVSSAGRLFYISQLASTGAELWTSDGTAAGTQLVKDIQPGAGSSVTVGIVPFGSTVLVFADDGAHGFELWRSDGQLAGTKLVADLYPGSRSGSDQRVIYPAAGRAWFACTTPLGADELCVSDGTQAGTQRLPMAVQGTASSSPAGLVVFNGSAFFVATDGNTGRELYVTDGTGEGTQRLTDIDPGSPDGVRGNPIVCNGRLFFLGHTSAQGTELWASDGTAAGTYLVKDINPTAGAGGLDGMPTTGWAVALGNTLYFMANDGSTGYELWKSDGTSQGTVEVADLAPGAAQGVLWVFSSVVNNTLLVQGYDANRSPGLYAITNGATPVRISPGTFSAFKAAAAGNKVYLATDPGGTAPVGLWSTDGTASGTRFIAGGSFSELAVVGTQIVMMNAGVLYVSNGTAGNKRLLSLAAPYTFSNKPGLISLGHQLAFVGGNGTMGFGLWVSDLTRLGTIRLLPLPADISAWLQRDGTRLYFSSDATGYGRELWYTQLTEGSTVFAHDFAPGSAHGSPAGLTRLNSQQLLLSANDGAHGVELWRIDEVSP